ncbi:uncharacterized protein YdeI (YjbR/CyaY-like superfamily) [Pedobacter sp. UYEF25]
MTPIFFADQKDFRNWLSINHLVETELTVGFYKIRSGKATLTWGQSVDQALCFGWIDGVRNSIDAESYQIRFTKRKSNSIWSAVNIKKMEELVKNNLVKEAGLLAFEKRKPTKSKIYAFEQEEVIFSNAFEMLFKQNKAAWEYFFALAPSYKKTSTHWVMSAKTELTRQKRLGELIRESENGTNQWKHSKYKKSY